MFVLDYGLMSEIQSEKDVYLPLACGVPEGKSYQDKVKLYYNGTFFATIRDNHDHVTADLNGIVLTIDKSRAYKENGRDATILSHILYAFELRGVYKKLALKLRELLDQNFVYLFAETRNEIEV